MGNDKNNQRFKLHLLSPSLLELESASLMNTGIFWTSQHCQTNSPHYPPLQFLPALAQLYHGAFLFELHFKY